MIGKEGRGEVSKGEEDGRESQIERDGDREESKLKMCRGADRD